ncbi:hypothetical protein GCM10010319_58780 [Streptomyces blastmyceticus]|uniref:DUF7848 domain-containing protein n=1 Tax=Streptomyces blastmyceticus TaxID=68180 RepID=A0ABN0XTX7_9ACTN
MTTAMVRTREPVQGLRCVRNVWRFVLHRIVLHPETVTYGAQCLACDWKTEGADAPSPVQLACMKHTGRHEEHTAFWTYCRAMSYVQRAEKEDDASDESRSTGPGEGMATRGDHPTGARSRPRLRRPTRRAGTVLSVLPPDRRRPRAGRTERRRDG